MDVLKLKRHALFACIPLLFVSLTCEAQIYKWVDSAGRTHYSQSKEEAGKAKAEEMRANAQSMSGQTANESTASSQEERAFEQRRQQRLREEAAENAGGSSGDGFAKNRQYREESDNSKCSLARDILNGNAKHTSGARTDEHDREIAENDVRTFCR